MKHKVLFMLLVVFFKIAAAQDKIHIRAITLEEYNKAKNYSVKDLDKDTYVKFDNAYILDRYEMRKPYFIRGDDGKKKRIDLYKLIARDSLLELGTVIFYTNEKGKTYSAVQPNFIAGNNVWEKYFADLHTIEKEEPNFILKLSYVLSKEMSFQLYKALNGGKAIDESATYGTDICFPGDELVRMADGNDKELARIVPGDKVITIDQLSHKTEVKEVVKLVAHAAKNYAITQLMLISVTEVKNSAGNYVSMTHKLFSATPNHPIFSSGKIKKVGDVSIGDFVTCLDDKTKRYKTFTVVNKIEHGQGVQHVYNLEIAGGSTFMMNGVVVNQK